jgi:hypothetical protein
MPDEEIARRVPYRPTPIPRTTRLYDCQQNKISHKHSWSGFRVDLGFRKGVRAVNLPQQHVKDTPSLLL